MPHVLNKMDIIIYTVIVGSVVGVAYYAAAIVVSRMVRRSGTDLAGVIPEAAGKRWQGLHLKELYACDVFCHPACNTSNTLSQGIRCFFLTQSMPRHGWRGYYADTWHVPACNHEILASCVDWALMMWIWTKCHLRPHYCGAGSSWWVQWRTHTM